jgi:hypothetical protein
MSHWPINVFKLASPGDAHGVACDGEGAFVGAIPLLEERGDVWCKFTECNERCSKLLERYKTYSYSNVNEFHYRQCMNECLGIG